MIHKLISRSGSYGSFKQVGKNRDKDMGVMVNLNAGEKVVIDTIESKGMFVPFTFVGEGEVIVDTLLAFDFGGDLCDLWASLKSRVTIRHLYAMGDNPTRPYEEYHPDTIQIENLGRNFKPNSEGSGNIWIPDIDVTLSGEQSAGVTMSGRGRNTNIHLGTERWHMDLKGEKVMAVNTYSADNCRFGGLDVKCNKPVRIDPRGRTECKSYSNKVAGLLQL